jgi:murein DD-endopeptidase MepM/ murein hydrolase activator NlpD
MSTHITSANAIGVEGVRDGLSIENRQKLSDLAAEFESMLLNHLLRDMNEAGKWSSLGEEGDTLGAGTFEQTFQQEFAGYLAKAGGMGLSQQLLKALDDVMGKTGEAATGGYGAAGTDRYAAAGAMVAAAPSTGVPMSAAELNLPESKVTSTYGWRRDPFTGESKFHKGVDFRAAEGSDVQSAGAGRVTFAGNLPGYGTTVVVEHANGLSTRYAHLSELLVNTGDQVADRQSIGRAGQSGKATAAHLHFEVLEDGVPVDPFR